MESQKTNCDDSYFSLDNVEKIWYELSFLKGHKDMVLKTYLPFVLERSKAIKEENKDLGSYGGESVNLDHPWTVRKAWKRGYLLYGPPGTGKSSLIAAMANYLKFDIYDMELSSMSGNADFRRMLVSTNSRSIIVIEDIDCTIRIHNRDDGPHNYNDSESRMNSYNPLDPPLNIL